MCWDVQKLAKHITYLLIQDFSLRGEYSMWCHIQTRAVGGGEEGGEDGGGGEGVGRGLL